MLPWDAFWPRNRKPSSVWLNTEESIDSRAIQPSVRSGR
jgi:hypothetical protein